MDIVDKKTRSRMMGLIRGKDTKPELRVRRLAHALGYRFRLHCKKLPGTPDLVFPGRKAVILVHGCFWHRHPGCSSCTNPGSNVEFWADKFVRNIERDQLVCRELRAKGWRVLVVWECETGNISLLGKRLTDHLENIPGQAGESIVTNPRDPIRY